MVGVPYNMRKSIEFIAFTEACSLIDTSFKGQKFTFKKKRDMNQRICKMLVRALINDNWLVLMQQTTITHLSSTSSNHLNCKENDLKRGRAY